MYKISDPFFEDIKTQEARDNFDSLVEYLCSSLGPNEKIKNSSLKIAVEDEILIDGNYEEEHLSFANMFYSPQNLKLVNEVLKNRVTYHNIDSCDPHLIDGFSYINRLDKEKIMELSTMKFYSSVSAMEHELIHILMALNNNNPQPQHTEILSIFGQLLSLISFSQKNNNPDIYKNALVNICISRMLRKVFTSQLSDEAFERYDMVTYNMMLRPLHKNYAYMLGLIYATRLLNIYRDNSESVLSKINDILSGKYSVEELLSDYHISLTDKNTYSDFIDLCNQYRDIVKSRYSADELHRINIC